MGIEPTFEAWEASILPLNYARCGIIIEINMGGSQGGKKGVGIRRVGTAHPAYYPVASTGTITIFTLRFMAALDEMGMDSPKPTVAILWGLTLR